MEIYNLFWKKRKYLQYMKINGTWSVAEIEVLWGNEQEVSVVIVWVEDVSGGKFHNFLDRSTLFIYNYKKTLVIKAQD